VVLLDASSDVTRDAPAADRAADTARDTSISLRDVAAGDVAEDETGLVVTDARSDATDALAADARPASDTGAIDTSLPRDTSPAPSPDAYVAPADAAVTPSGKLDSGTPNPPVSGYKLMGGGFCSVSPSDSGAPGLATLFLVVAFGTLIVRRRRR
jgi:MYXO-CTERM domain-containing protein